MQPNDTTKTTAPLILLMFTIVCALPAAVIPSAIAQEDDDVSLLDNEEGLASSIVSEVLEEGDADDTENVQNTTNTATEDSNQEQDVDEDNVGEFGDDSADLDDTNVAVSLGIPINVQEEEEVVTPRPPDDGELPPAEEPPEFVAFCNEQIDGRLFGFDFDCYDTLEDCVIGEEIFRVEDIECEGFETLPPNAGDCVVFTFEGRPTGATCGRF